MSKNQCGFTIPIGGHENKTINSKILNKFVELCGGKNAKIAVIPAASDLSDAGNNYVKLFEKLGVSQVYNLKIEDTYGDRKVYYIDKLKEATGIFITGGDQRRLLKVLDNTEVETIIKQRSKEDKLHVAGTSAGAVYVCEHILASGESGLLPGGEMITLGKGLGLLKNVIVDQHFSQRDRLGRLLTALSTSSTETTVGLGIDEDTAAFIDPNGCLEVIGSGQITIIDISKVEYAAINKKRKGKPIDLSGVIMHILSENNKFKLDTKEVIPTHRSNLEVARA